MKILEPSFWRDFSEKRLNFSAKYRYNIHKLDFGIILVKMGLKCFIDFCLRFQGGSSQAT